MISFLTNQRRSFEHLLGPIWRLIGISFNDRSSVTVSYLRSDFELRIIFIRYKGYLRQVGIFRTVVYIGPVLLKILKDAVYTNLDYRAKQLLI